MKKKILLIVLSVIAVFCIATVIYFSNNYTYMHNEEYEYHGELYSPCGGPYIKDHLISFSKDLIRIYSVEGDAERIYIVDSLSKSLFKKKSFSRDQGPVTGIFSGPEGKYINDQLIIDTIVNMQDFLSDESGVFYDYKPYNLKRIYLCYEGICASDEFFGYIYKCENEYYYVEDVGAFETTISGILIDPEIYDTLKAYIFPYD